MVEFELELNQERGWETLALWSQPPCEKGELTRFQTVRRSRGFKLFTTAYELKILKDAMPAFDVSLQRGRRKKRKSRKQEDERGE